jgi:palmitoyl-protein thioesterase
MKLPLALLSLISVGIATPLHTYKTPLPVLIWHGLGDNYAADGINDVAKLIEETHPGTFVYPIRVAEDPSSDRSGSFLGNTTEQIQQVCADIAAHPILSTAPAVDALGFSQGGVFLRAYAQRCNAPPLRSLVTFGSPHNGISDYQACGATDWLCKGAMALLHTNTWSSFVQSRLVPAQYYRETDPETGKPTDDYLEHSNLLADINNERKLKNKTYAENLANLEKFVMFEFEDDTTVIPKESEWFAQVNETSTKVIPLKDRPIYKEDWIGLKALDEKDGLVFKTTPGGHMELSQELLSGVFKEYFGPERKKKSRVSATQTPRMEVGNLDL